MIKDFGKKIKLKRVSLNINQTELAEMTGFSQNYISLIERQQRSSTLSVQKIFETLKNFEMTQKTKKKDRNNIIKVKKNK